MKLGSTILSLVVVASVVASAVACGDSASEKAAAAAAKTEQQLQDDFLTQYCEIVLPCCNKILQKSKEDVAGCKTRIMALDPVTVKTAQARTDCITQAKAAAPDPKFCSDFAQAKTPSCPDASRAMLAGTKKVGEICNNANECAPDFTGIVDCAAGACQVRRRGAEGDGPCDQTVDGDVTSILPQPADGSTVYTCFLSADGLQCESESKKCVKPLEEHGKCTNNSQCDKAHYCSDEMFCAPKLGKDSKCDVNEECQGHCAITKADTGGFCADKVGEDGDCETPAFCTDGLDCVSGKCIKPGADVRLGATCGG